MTLLLYIVVRTISWALPHVAAVPAQALFRALKTKHETPKYGLIYHASLIGQAAPKNKVRCLRSTDCPLHDIHKRCNQDDAHSRARILLW
jgi:snoRNA binding domain, fibrillarin